MFGSKRKNSVKQLSFNEKINFFKTAIHKSDNLQASMTKASMDLKTVN